MTEGVAAHLAQASPKYMGWGRLQARNYLAEGERNLTPCFHWVGKSTWCGWRIRKFRILLMLLGGFYEVIYLNKGA